MNLLSRKMFRALALTAAFSIKRADAARAWFHHNTNASQWWEYIENAPRPGRDYNIPMAMRRRPSSSSVQIVTVR